MRTCRRGPSCPTPPCSPGGCSSVSPRASTPSSRSRWGTSEGEARGRGEGDGDGQEGVRGSPDPRGGIFPPRGGQTAGMRKTTPKTSLPVGVALAFLALALATVLVTKRTAGGGAGAAAAPPPAGGR